MKQFIKKHKKKIIAGHGAIVVAILTTTMAAMGTRATLYFVPASESALTVGDTVEIDVNINAAVPINALGTTIDYPEDMIEIIGISKARSFLDLWTEETAIKEDDGILRFSGGTLRKGGLAGIGTALTLTVRAKAPGDATFTFEDAEVHAHNATGDVVPTELRSLSYTITEIGSSGEIGTAAASTAPNADFDGKGGITLVDMSILTMRIFSDYDARYDLNRDGSLNLSDLSIFFTEMQKR